MAKCPDETTSLAHHLGAVQRKQVSSWNRRGLALAFFVCCIAWLVVQEGAFSHLLGTAPAAPEVKKGFPWFSVPAPVKTRDTDAIVRLDKEIQIERQKQAVLQQLRSQNANERNSALQEYLHLSWQSGRRGLMDFLPKSRRMVVNAAHDIWVAGKEAALAVDDALEDRFPTAAKVIHGTSSTVRRTVKLVVPPVRETINFVWSGCRNVLSPVMGPGVSAARKAVKATYSRTVAFSHQLADDFEGTIDATMQATVGKHPRKFAAAVAAAVVYEHGRRARVKAGQTGWAALLPRPSSKESVAMCTEGMLPVSVPGAPGPQCTQLPICAGTQFLGNCPPASPEFPYPSTCRSVGDNIYGCVLEEVEAPLDAEVQT